MASLVPKLWSKLDSVLDVTNPQIGPNGTIHGAPIFSAAYYGNGIDAQENNANYATWPLASLELGLSKGTVEFWAKKPAVIGAGPHWVFWSIGDATNCIYFEFYRHTVPPGFWLEVHVIIGGVEIINCRAFAPGSFPSWGGTGLCPYTHIAVVWDRTGTDIGGGKTVAIYTDDELEASNVTTWGAVSVSGNFIFLNRYSLDMALNCIVDNIKIHNVCKIDFNDRGIENYLLGSNHNFLGNTAASCTGMIEAKNRIWFWSYTCPKSGYLVKIRACTCGPLSPSISGKAFAVYDASLNLLKSTYGQFYSAGPGGCPVGCLWFDWPFRPPPLYLEKGKTYYFAVWGCNEVSRVCGDGYRADSNYFDYSSAFFSNFPNSISPTHTLNYSEPCWYLILNTDIGDAIIFLSAPDHLLCEQLVNPISVSDPKPEFSAIHHYE